MTLVTGHRRFDSISYRSKPRNILVKKGFIYTIKDSFNCPTTTTTTPMSSFSKQINMSDPSSGKAKWIISQYQYIAILISVILSFCPTTTHAQTRNGFSNIRLCVPEDLTKDCHTMANLFPGLITCVPAKDKFACMGTIARGEADTMNVDPEDLYLAGSIFGLEPFLMEEYDKRRYRYGAAVLIPKNSDIARVSDLRGKTSCHTGYGRNAGFYMPLGNLINQKVMQRDCRGLLHTTENFFHRSCLPGRWSKDPMVDMMLKRKHPKLCSLCKNPSTCSATDEYAGYEGAIKCLIDGRGQVAFTTVQATIEYFSKTSQDLVDDYHFLCPNGERQKVNSNACDWGRRPNNAWVIRPDRLESRAKERTYFYNFLEQIHFRNKVTPTRPFPPVWYDKVLVSNSNVTQILKVSRTTGRDSVTYSEYLGDYLKSIQMGTSCSKKVIRICTTSQSELFKCLDLQKVALSRRITPEIRCENPGYSLESCLKAVADGVADFVSLKVGDYYRAARYMGLRAVARERNNHSDISSYSVAVVRVPSEVVTLEDLRNATVCSTGFGDISGWIAPIGRLIQQRLIFKETCSRSREVSEFFQSGCVPGVGDYRYNVNVSGADILCQACLGNQKGQHICEKSASEMYAGEAGAFRCLVERRGSVAFVSHTTPLAYTDRTFLNSSEYWAASLRSDDFRLLCRQGGQAMLSDYEKCNMAQIPSRFIVTREDIGHENYTEMVHFLTTLSDTFTNKARYSFKLFGSEDGEHDLLFGDSSSSIVAVDEETDYTDQLGNFLPIVRNMDPVACENFATGLESRSLLSTLSIILLSHLVNHLLNNNNNNNGS
ncbi:transferrin-like [Brevipalpus obovatus]|uniref:transferrin-like n=1 Tax=Brevipalpus obovatus TaxID=246614 RepID=UPI003D9EA004